MKSQIISYLDPCPLSMVHCLPGTGTKVGGKGAISNISHTMIIENVLSPSLSCGTQKMASFWYKCSIVFHRLIDTTSDGIKSESSFSNTESGRHQVCKLPTIRTLGWQRVSLSACVRVCVRFFVSRGVTNCQFDQITWVERSDECRRTMGIGHVAGFGKTLQTRLWDKQTKRSQKSENETIRWTKQSRIVVTGKRMNEKWKGQVSLSKTGRELEKSVGFRKQSLPWFTMVNAFGNHCTFICSVESSFRSRFFFFRFFCFECKRRRDTRIFVIHKSKNYIWSKNSDWAKYNLGMLLIFNKFYPSHYIKLIGNVYRNEAARQKTHESKLVVFHSDERVVSIASFGIHSQCE